MSFDEFSHGIGITERRHSLFERLQVFWADEYGGWGPVLGDHDTLVVRMDTLDELGEAVAHRPQGFTRHGHNCATPDHCWEDPRRSLGMRHDERVRKPHLTAIRQIRVRFAVP